ncbi:uncharacterized protein LOC116959373 [Tyto alba]|uniref:uncharacterized protein LOC116959373 n=1 Tax=Tyto alba TaxID=56313 RepID=UPI001C675F99|nr:uncharacterized protein LOC116959373 [Tyto alba]
MAMGLQAIILLCAVVAGASGRSLESLSYGASCFADCVGHSASYFPRRGRYSYRYSAVTSTFLQGSVYNSSGISLESTVIIEVQDVQIKKSLASREEPLKEMDNLREILEQHPLLFSFHDGKVLKLCPMRSEQTWALNIKRGILSVLQTSQASTASAIVEEVDVLGICPTRYQQKGPILVKTRDLNLCSHRYSGFTSVQSVVLPHISSEQQILSSKLECVQSIKDGVLTEAKCADSNLVTLFSQKGSGAKTQTQSSLELFQVEAETLYKKVDPEDLYVTSMLYEREETERKITAGEVTELVWKLCLAHSASFETADLFMTLVFDLRHLSLEALKALWQRSSFKCRDNWQPLTDALPSCATEPCVVLMKEIITSREVEEDKVEYFFWSFSFIPKPTSGMIESLAPLLKSPGASQSCFLGVTALLHRFCSSYNSCDGVPAVQSVMRTLGKFLGGNCTVQDSERLSEMQLVLKAIGNAGLAAASLAPALSLCASLKSNPIEIRLAAVQAFRRIPCSVRNDLLIQLYQATSEDVEIRIAAYYIAMKCPHEELFKQVQNTLLKETSSQVGSFVWSHLSQLLETDDPLKEHLRDSIPDEILSRDFDQESWKYSSYSDATFHSAGAGANMEASVVFSPASFLPRSVMTNMTVHLMGQAINLLEVDVRLENAEALVQKIFGQNSATFSDYFFANTNEKKHKSENPEETTGKVKRKKMTSKQYNPSDHLVTKSGKPKLRKANQNCPGRKYSKMNELVKKFTERTVRKEALKCELSMKVFGNELSFLDCEDLRKKMKHYSLNLAELAVQLLKGQEVQFNKRLSLATEELQFPAISGFPVQLAVNASAAINIKFKGNADFKQQSDFFLNGYIKPSSFVQLSVQMGTVGTLGQAGLSWLTGVRTSTSLDGGIQVKKGRELKVFLNTPEESMEIINFSSKLHFTVVDEMEDTDVFQDHTETRSCIREDVSEIIGWQLCSEMSYPDRASGLAFPLTGPLRVAVTLTKQDRGLQQYVVEAAYNYIPQEDSWIPNEAVLHFFIGTPKSDLKRDVGVDLNFSIPQKKFRIQFIQPKKKIKIDGRIEFSKNSRIGHLELIVDDRDVYYIKGMTDLQILSGEHRYMTQLEVKLIKQSSPVVLSGNITKQLGKKIAFSVSLNNLLKDAAFLSAFLEKKVGDKLRQYSLEGEAYLPGVLGVHVIDLLQQHEGLWSHGLRIKYGLLGEAKNLHHECSMRQKIKVETGARGVYKLDIGHEFHCMQTPTYNHKVHLKHEASASWLSSRMEVNYGKHWDEISNKKKLLISQTFKNSSSSSLVNYFMEFTIQVLEKQVNYRTQLQHSHNSQVYLQSSTSFEVQYNDHMPFVAGLQWKDASRNGLKNWEGGLNIDTPWLYLYAAHKLHQSHHSTYLLTMKLTTGKALSIKNLIVELFYKDQDNEKEGKVHIYTPATTYLQASTFNHFGRNVLHSYSEVISLWNQLVKNEIHLENNERAKFLCFKMKCTKWEFNFTASYQNLPMPKTTNFSVKTVWKGYKSLPVMLRFEGQIEERKKKMLYQKRGTFHFRHPFKVPILQSFLLQETFTVDKKQRHYLLETKVLINGVEETVQTFTLGYHPENPYICAGLTHPYNYRLFPKDVEICIFTQSHQNVKHELETTLKVNKEDVLTFLGRYQNKSSETDFRHLLRMDVTHSFQIEFPQAMDLSGELFSRQTKMEHFDYGMSIKTIINKNVSSQAQAVLKSYGESNLNGSLYLHSSGRDMLMLELDMNNENRKNAKVVELRAFLHQTILTNPESIQFELMGKIFPSRLLISSEMKLNENRLHMDFMGAKEQKVGFVLSLNGRIQHTFAVLKAIPHLLSLNGLLKCKNNIRDGNINVMVNKTQYGLRLRNRNVFGNTTIHSIAFAMFQNGSHAIPMETKLKGHLELSKEMKRGLASFQVDEKALSLDISNIMSHGHIRVNGTLTHNISFLKNAGLPLDGILTAMSDHGTRNHTITIALQSGSERITAVFGGHRLSTEPPKSQLSVSLKHNISKIKKHGIPFIVEAAGYYEGTERSQHVLEPEGIIATQHSEEFPRKIAAWITTTVEMEQLKIEIEKKTTGSGMEISLSLHHDVGGLMDIVPCILEVACRGESANKELSGLCNGAIMFQHFETPARVSLNGSIFTSNFTVIFFGHVSFHDIFACLQLNATTNIQPHLEMDFQHSLPSLQSLGIARENQVKVSAMRSDKYKAMLGVVLGPCSLNADGEVSLASNETDTEWILTFRNKCFSLERMGLPHAVAFGGSFQQNICSVGLLMNLQCDGRTVDVQIDTSCKHEYMLQGMLRHSVHWLSQLGLPFENSVLLSAATDSTTEGILLLQAGKCKLKARGDLSIWNKPEWTLETETECQLLQELSIPTQSRLTGSIHKDKCQAELLCVLETEGKTAHLEVRAECKPKIILAIQFRHDLPQLKEIPRENKVSITAQKQLKYHIGIGMKSGACELQMNGDFDPEKKLQWKIFIENKCQTIQDLGAPLKIDGSGYVLMDKMNLDSQTLITVDENKLQGLFILKVTDERQELDAVLTHNIQGAADIGIPMRMLVDVISEKNNNFYKRLTLFCVNSKQITEELSFVQKLDVLSLNYKLTHNIEALKTLQIKDRIELQAILNLKAIKSFHTKVHYGAYVTVLEGQIQEFETSTNITGNFYHTWPWLLQARVPSSLQVDVFFQGRNTTQERYMRIAAGETSITYILNSYYVGHQVDIFCQSVHSSEALQASGYPKAINLNLIYRNQVGTCHSLQVSSGWIDFMQAVLKFLENEPFKMALFCSGYLENKAKTICEVQCDDKDITVTVDVDTDFQFSGVFELMAEVKHSVSLLHHLGLPFFLKMTIQEVLTENEIEGALRLTYEQNTNFSFTISRKKDQQGEELNIKALQTHPLFLQCFPSAAELSSKVNYDMSEAKGKLYLRMEKMDFSVTAKLTFTGASYTNVIEIIQTMSQLILPRHLVFMTVYQKGSRTRMLRHTALWDGKEIKVTGTYTGLFPKLPGGHDIQVELFHPLSIPFPWHARVNFYVKHSARSHRDDLTVIWNEKDQVQQPRANKCQENYKNIKWFFFSSCFKGLTYIIPLRKRNREILMDICLRSVGEKCFISHVPSTSFHMDQILVSSSLKFGRDRMNYRATVAHPFNYTLKKVEIHSLSERRGRKYNQQLQLTGNGGQPADIRLTLEDKSKMNITAWNGCMTLSSGQLQRVLSMEHLHACGSLEQRSALFNEYLDLNWDDKKFKHNLTYERNPFLYPDKFQLEAVLENIFLTSCTKQKILGKIETNYSSCLDYHMSFESCDIPNAIVFSGKHQLNKDDIILQSEGRLHLADHGRDEGLIGVSLKNQSTADVKNYSLEIELRAFEDIWLGLTGTATSSSVQSQILVEGIFDQKEKVKLAASKGEECFQYYIGYLKGDLEEGMEVSACTDGQQIATVNTYLSINGERQENMGQMTLAAVNGSLSFLAHGCGDPVLKAEHRLNEIGSLLKARLMEKIKKLDGYMWRFRRSVQQVDFLSEAAGWPSIALQKVAGFLHSVGRAVAQVWKQSGIRQILRSKLPLYLDKIQDIVQQMQNELQKPLATLKDAYYDVTLKPLDEVWQEKTEEYMKKIQAFLPKIVKDVWLMEPIQVALKAVKAGLDMTTQQMLRWAEAMFSRAVSKIRKPLLNLYSFSARNCSVAVKLPILPKADCSLDLANVTNYLIEEKLMRPLQDLYNINIVAQYYRFKRRMMESPFEYHAMLMGTKHIMTFDGKFYDLASKCSVLLAKDFVHNTFTVILNEETSNLRSLYVEMNQTVITVYPRLKISKIYNFSFMEENCQVLDQPLENTTTNSRRETNKIEVSNQKGVSVSCDFQYDLCTVTLAGWHHGISAGLFGTNDNEAGNEWILPNCSFTDNMQEFTQSWQVTRKNLHVFVKNHTRIRCRYVLSFFGLSGKFSILMTNKCQSEPYTELPVSSFIPSHSRNLKNSCYRCLKKKKNQTPISVILFSQVNKCSLVQKKVKPCEITAKQKVCKVFFEESHSPLGNCFKVVDPAPFYSMCTDDTCDSQELKAACSLAAAFVHLCNRNFVPVEIPHQWFFLKLSLHWTFCLQYLLTTVIFIDYKLLYKR